MKKASLAQPVDGVSYQLLAGTRLPGDEDGGSALGSRPDIIFHHLDSSAGSLDIVDGILGLGVLPRLSLDIEFYRVSHAVHLFQEVLYETDIAEGVVLKCADQFITSIDGISVADDGIPFDEIHLPDLLFTGLQNLICLVGGDHVPDVFTRHFVQVFKVHLLQQIIRHKHDFFILVDNEKAVDIVKNIGVFSRKIHGFPSSFLQHITIRAQSKYKFTSRAFCVNFYLHLSFCKGFAGGKDRAWIFAEAEG